MMEFEVEHTTGDICISGTLDFETRTSYEFPVIATDQGKILKSMRLYSIVAKTWVLAMPTCMIIHAHLAYVTNQNDNNNTIFISS